MKGKTWKLKICRAKQRWGKDGVIYRKGTRQFSFLYWWYNNILQKVVFWERSFSIPDIFKMFLKVYTYFILSSQSSSSWKENWTNIHSGDLGSSLDGLLLKFCDPGQVTKCVWVSLFPHLFIGSIEHHSRSF